MLEVRNLSVSAGGKKIIKDFSFTFERGKIYAIMGPNGSGKSTLAFAIMGHPTYKVNGKSRIVFKTEVLNGLDAQKRAQKGLFMSFQTPLALSGVTPYQLLQMAQSGKKDPLTLRKEVKSTARELKIPEDLLSRSLNESASGGEKKKLEILQAAILNKSVQVFDEIDTGVDIDALKTITAFLKRHKKEKTYILITHYNRVLHYLRPDRVLVLIDGKLVVVGDYKLAKRIENEGYKMTQLSS